jgi:hypothetical protein
MIQTLEAEIDEQGSVHFAQPVRLEGKHRVLVMIMPVEARGAGQEAPEGWDHPYVEQQYRYLPSSS